MFVAFLGSLFVLTVVGLAYLGLVSLQIAVSENKTPEASEESGIWNLEMGELVNGEIFRTLGKDFELRYPKDWSLAKLPPLPPNLIERWRLAKDPKKVKGLVIDIEVIPGAGEEPVLSEKMKINGAEYQKTIVTQKEAISKIIVSTFFDNKTFRVTAFPSKDPQDLQELEAIFSTFRIIH